MTTSLRDLIAAVGPDQLADIIASLPPTVAEALLNDPEITAQTTPEVGSLVDLGHKLIPNFSTRPHIDYLATVLTEAVAGVEAGESQYLTIELPPRAGKSTIATQLTPAWLLAKYPQWPLALLSHDRGLSTKWGRQIRRWVEGGQLPGVEVARDAGAVQEWETTQGGGVLSISTRESFTGRGAKVIIVDDPHKDFADAHSQTKRDAIWEWYKSVAYTRLHHPALVIIVQTRWHEDDLIGRVLSDRYEGDPNQWRRIKIPAIAEADDVLGRAPGEPLLSPIIDEDAPKALARWTEVKSVVGSYTWQAMYQQNPTPPDGRIVSRKWLRYYDHAPGHFDTMLQSWDLAFGESETSSYVVGQVWGKQGANVYLLDQFRERTDFVGTIAAIQQMTAKWPQAKIKLVERKANGSAVLSTLRNKVAGLIPVDPTGSKLARLHSVTPQLESGNVYLPTMAPWTRDLVEELVGFPSHAHDDQVDALTQALERFDTNTERAKVKVSVL